MNLNIRQFPAEVLRALKVEAARAGVTLREFVIGRLGEVKRVRDGVSAGVQGGKGEKPSGVRSSRRERARGESGAMDGGIRKDSVREREAGSGEEVKKKLSMEQFLKLSNSDKMRAQREGIAP